MVNVHPASQSRDTRDSRPYTTDDVNQKFNASYSFREERFNEDVSLDVFVKFEYILLISSIFNLARRTLLAWV